MPRSITNIFTFLPSTQLNGAIGVNQFTFSILCRFSEVTDVNRSICIELTTVSTDLIFFVLGLKDFIVWEDHAIDAMRNISALSELSQPLWTLLINDLLKFKIIIVKIKGLINIVKEVLNWERTKFLPVLKWFLLFLRIHIWNSH